MTNILNKPKQTASQLVQKMKEKGITFSYITEEEAASYLENRNNYLRTAAYRKNYQKHLKGPCAGKYIDLDFSYLQELSTIDMHLRFMITKMCLDIEHDLKVRLLKDVEHDSTTDGYDIVQGFLSQHPYILKKIEATSASPFTCDLIQKYFSISQEENNQTGKLENTIDAYDDCPAWVLVEILTFGDFIKFYDYYYSARTLDHISKPAINLVKSLRNGAAHNNCLVADLARGTSRAPNEIRIAVVNVPAIKQNQRKKKLSCRPMLEFVTLLYVYNQVVSERVKAHRIEELKLLFFERMTRRKAYFEKNELITSNYEFACKVILAFFPKEEEAICENFEMVSERSVDKKENRA